MTGDINALPCQRICRLVIVMMLLVAGSFVGPASGAGTDSKGVYFTGSDLELTYFYQNRPDLQVGEGILLDFNANVKIVPIITLCDLNILGGVPPHADSLVVKFTAEPSTGEIHVYRQEPAPGVPNAYLTDDKGNIEVIFTPRAPGTYRIRAEAIQWNSPRVTCPITGMYLDNLNKNNPLSPSPILTTQPIDVKGPSMVVQPGISSIAGEVLFPNRLELSVNPVLIPPGGYVRIEITALDGSVPRANTPVRIYEIAGDGTTRTSQFVTMSDGKVRSELYGGKAGIYTIKAQADSWDTGSAPDPVLATVKVSSDPHEVFTMKSPQTTFTASPTFGPAPLDVTFVATTQGEVDAQDWDFGDGYMQLWNWAVDYSPNPLLTTVHTYEKPGTYSVRLSQVNAGGTTEVSNQNLITVTGPLAHTPHPHEMSIFDMILSLPGQILAVFTGTPPPSGMVTETGESGTTDVGAGITPSPSDGAACNDGSVCTVNDRLVNGVCTGTPINCDDGNPRTGDSCESRVGCIHIPSGPLMPVNAKNGDPCNDMNPCTLSDTVSNGVCIGTLIPCSDGDDLTADACDPETGQCIFTPAGKYVKHAVDVVIHPDQILPQDGTSCDDGNKCTVSDTMINGVCVGTAIYCDDGYELTEDSCDPNTGQCVFTQIAKNLERTTTAIVTPDIIHERQLRDGMICNDNNLCTVNDRIAGGQCAGTPIVCNDGDSSTLDTCDQSSGQCLFIPFGDLTGRTRERGV